MAMMKGYAQEKLFFFQRTGGFCSVSRCSSTRTSADRRCVEGNVSSLLSLFLLSLTIVNEECEGFGLMV